jgi:hypothetical protein
MSHSSREILQVGKVGKRSAPLSNEFKLNPSKFAGWEGGQAKRAPAQVSISLSFEFTAQPQQVCCKQSASSGVASIVACADWLIFSSATLT